MSRQDRIDEAAQFLGLAAGHFAVRGREWKEVGLYDGLFHEALIGPSFNEKDLASLREKAIHGAEQYIRKCQRVHKIDEQDFPHYTQLRRKKLTIKLLPFRASHIGQSESDRM